MKIEISNQKLSYMLDECMEECESIGIEADEQAWPVTLVKVNNRLSRAHGRCIYHNRYRTCTIEISGKLMNTGNDEWIKNTLMHEYLHSLTYGEHHGGRWAEYAKRVNHDLGYGVERTANAEESKAVQEQYRYQGICHDCGAKYTFARKRKYFDYISECTCSDCHSHNIEVTDTKTGKVYR